MSCIIVLGCYRSGTSAAAGVLHHLGVCMGNAFDKPNKNNPKGYWEDVEFKNLHEKILADLDVTEEYLELIKERSKLELWGVKDPRLTSLLSELVKCLNAIGVNHKVIDCHRPAKDIATSIYKGTGGESVDWWLPFVQNYLDNKAESLIAYPGEILQLDFSEIQEPNYVQKIADYVGVADTQAAMAFMGFDQSPGSS